MNAICLNLRIVCCILLTTLPLSIQASGGWVGGGGELLRDKNNPWFLSNIKNVYYCILIDQKTFGIDNDRAEAIVEKAIHFWQSEFKHEVSSGTKAETQNGIASQDFHKLQNCSSQSDITFQLGLLNKKQKKFLGNPPNFAAISVRTYYDSVNLKGRGFIYVSPPKGPLALNSKEIPHDIWSISNSKFLYLTLVHELGHVFGLPHGGSYGSLMSEGFVESMLSFAKTDEKLIPENRNYFSFKNFYPVICPELSVVEKWKKIFILHDKKCLQFIFDHHPKNMLFGKSILKVMASQSQHSTQELIATVDLVLFSFFPIYTSLIWLPEGQKYVSPINIPPGIGRNILGPVLLSISKKGRFTNRSGDSLDILVDFQQGSEIINIISSSIQGELVKIL